MTKPFVVLLLRTLVVSATAIAAVIATSRVGWAFEMDPTRCFSTAPVWNAKKGVIVSGTSPGPIAAVLGGVGEVRTHSMISNGDWATHSTTLVPSIKTVNVTIAGIKVGTTPDQDRPLKPNELAVGRPGFQQINVGGAYAYWQTATQVWTQVSPPIIAAEILNPSICGARCKTQGAADWLWETAPWVMSGNGTMYYLGFNDANGNLHPLPYGVHQYMDGIDRITMGAETDEWWQRGMVCSQVPPYAYKHWVDATNPNIISGTGSVNYQTYSHAETTNAGVALWNSVYNSCMGNDAGFWGGIANAVTSFYYGTSVQSSTCNHAAWQVLNCFFQGETSSSSGCGSIASSPWNTYANNGNATGARSLSPEGLMGLNGKPTSGPWARWTQGALQWNGGGSFYGCYW